MKDLSKELSGTDASGDQFKIDTLSGDPSRGFNGDMLYYTDDKGIPSWYIFELLRCQSVSVDFSHPSRYWDINNRKFLGLWALRQCLNRKPTRANLLLVNYDDEREWVKLLTVQSISVEKIETIDKLMTFLDWQIMFRAFNKNKSGNTWDILDMKL